MGPHEIQDAQLMRTAELDPRDQKNLLTLEVTLVELLSNLMMSEVFSIYMCELNLSSETPHSLPTCYTDYTDIFNKKADSTLLPLRGKLNHSINLKPSCTALFGPLYNLSEHELQVLKEYIEKNLESGFIT